MTIPVYWWTNHHEIDARGPWDTGILEHLFDGELWDHGRVFSHQMAGPGYKMTGYAHAVFVVPARHHASEEDIAALNEDLAQHNGVILMLMGDEEAVFPWREVKHENIRFWVQMPRPGVHDDIPVPFFFGNGYKEDTSRLLRQAGAPAKRLDWVFAGQVTHERRRQAVNGLTKAGARTTGEVLRTEGFAQGVPRSDYLHYLRRAKVCPAPSGPCSQDTFRFYEALEAGSIPLPDRFTPDRREGYWEMVYGTDFPFVRVMDWAQVGGEIESLMRDWQLECALAGAWWKQQKRWMALRLHADLCAIGAKAQWPTKVTAVITTSPIPSHPSLSILEETLYSLWAQLGEIDVVIACDGVRPEQQKLAAAYHEYLREVVWRSNHEWRNVVPVVSRHHRHQAGVTRLALEEHVYTPLMLFMEHDTPFSDEPIDWKGCIEMMEQGALDVLRFHHEAQVHPEHEHLMIDHETRMLLDVPVRRTTQWSQRPHLARVSYYDETLHDYFPPGSSTMIEDRMHGIAQSYPGKHRLAIYHPDGTIRRTLHTDGRQDEPKFKMRFG